MNYGINYRISKLFITKFQALPVQHHFPLSFTNIFSLSSILKPPSMAGTFSLHHCTNVPFYKLFPHTAHTVENFLLKTTYPDLKN